MTEVVCPFCGSFRGNGYNVQHHIEEYHTDDSPFVIREAVAPSASLRPTTSRSTDAYSNGSMPEDLWVRCTRRGCGEHVLRSEIDEHLDFHEAAALSEKEFEDLPPPLPPRRSPPRSRSPPRRRFDDAMRNHRSSEDRLSRTVRGDRVSVSRFRIPAAHASTTKAVGPDTGMNPAPRSPRKLASPRKPRSRSPPPADRRSKSSGNNLLNYFSGTSSLTSQARTTLRKLKEPQNPGRLGKRELGPHAFEDSMPSSVRQDLIYGAEPQSVNRIGRDGRTYRVDVYENETSRLIPILADLSSLDPDVRATYLCHPCTKHIRKIYCDGNFCGYWSTQVVLSYVHHVRPYENKELPNVLEMQNLIERAWDNGICQYGRIETGGIKNTRKWIGTNEALAFFTEIGVGMDALSFQDGDDGSGNKAVTDLLDRIEAYFINGINAAQKHHTSYMTQLAPIYFQRFGHSMTIIGLERYRDGSRSLLIFDSSFETSDPMKRILAGGRTYSSAANLLKPYRRSELSLTRWDEFEVLIPHKLDGAETGSPLR